MIHVVCIVGSLVHCILPYYPNRLVQISAASLQRSCATTHFQTQANGSRRLTRRTISGSLLPGHRALSTTGLQIWPELNHSPSWQRREDFVPKTSLRCTFSRALHCERNMLCSGLGWSTGLWSTCQYGFESGSLFFSTLKIAHFKL